MLLLAFDTSGYSGSVALLNGASLLAERRLDRARRSAQTLIPAIEELLTGQQLEVKQIGLVATTIGPGSFTGLRVGVTAAKTLAYAIGADVIGLTTLEVLAHQAGGLPAGTEIHAVLDAQRKELFVGQWRVEEAAMADALPRLVDRQTASIVPAEAWLAMLQRGTVVIGSGLQKLVAKLPAGVTATSEDLWEPKAAMVGRLAWRAYQQGCRDDLWKLAPLYLRPSAAEEKAAR